MQSVVTTINVGDLLCNVAHSANLKAAAHAASGESVLCLLLGNRLASDGHAHQPQRERCSTRPFAISSLVTADSMICRSKLDAHGELHGGQPPVSSGLVPGTGH